MKIEIADDAILKRFCANLHVLDDLFYYINIQSCKFYSKSHICQNKAVFIL